ncbi:AIPR family protein [Pedobacter sp. UC225_61]|uniref:AIPR family protein n=1 Tax=Pedobacter sp. UC225_61 TaxID=3374623 RepID=UPI00378A6D1C
MEIQEYLKYRADLLNEAKDEDGFVTESNILELILPSLTDAKLIDSDDYNECYFNHKSDNIKINGFKTNESQERLQLFIVNEDSISLSNTESDLFISVKSYYDNIFFKATKFINKSIKKNLDDEVQDASPVKGLINFISSSHLGLSQIDVIEIFQISLTATVEKRGNEPQPKMIEFEDENISVTINNLDQGLVKKNIVVYKRLIDLNFLFNVLISQGNRELLEVDFMKLFDTGIEAIQAANEEHFESYLCVLPATILEDLYKRYSTRMLEKNVRSFLQFKGVNQGIKDTIKKTPEYFIAYNNGITITAVGGDILKHEKGSTILSLKDFQIVNGGQTTATIYFSKKEGLDISKIKVMAKINIAKYDDEDKLDDLISNISKFSNAQSKVSSADLRSRNSQLIKLKSVSESTMTPSGRKWFFERFKGEFNTLLRKNPRAKTKIDNEYPKRRRFTKEELAKYYMSWGLLPYLVKKGGDKIFKDFIDAISDTEKGINAPVINRDFYEEVVAKIIIFKELEAIYGAGKNSMGQLRSAVVPYSIAVLFASTTGSKSKDSFDLRKIWQDERIDDNLIQMLTELMSLMNILIKQYSESEDYGEYSKRKELWERILSSKEIDNFTNTANYLKAISKYTISKDELKKRALKNSKVKEIDFSNVYDNAMIFTRTAGYYKKLGLLLSDELTQSQRNKLDHIIYSINNKQDLDFSYCEFEKVLTQKIRAEKPELFDSINVETDETWIDSLDHIVSIYNKCIDGSLDIASEFQKHREIAKIKGAKFYAVFDEISKGFIKGVCPTMKQIQSVGNIQFIK